MRYQLDPLSPTGVSKAENKQGYSPYFAHGPGKPSLVDSVNGKHGAVQIIGGTNVTVDNSGKEIVINSSGGGGSGSGDVDGPASATNEGIARYDGVTGKLIQDSAVTIDDDGTIYADGGLIANETISTSEDLNVSGIANITTLQVFTDAQVDGDLNVDGDVTAPNIQYKTFITVGSTNCDYITDGTADEVQINQAITAVSAAGGGKVYLKDNAYYIDNVNIALKDNVWLCGAGRDMTILYGGPALDGEAVIADYNATLVDPSTNITLSDFTIDGSSMPTMPATTFRKGIDVLYTLNWVLQNVKVCNTPATGYGMDCNVNMQIINCIADTCGVSDSNPGYNGFGIGTGFYETESVQFTNCIALNCLNNGFLLEYVGGDYNSKDFQFTNCIADGNKRGFRVSGASSATFIDCKAKNSEFEGFYIQQFGVPNFPPYNITLIGCDAYDNGSDGIYLKDQEYGQVNAIIESSHSYGNAGDGIVCGGRYAQIKNNVSYANDNDGIFYHAFSATTTGDAQITGNICYNNGQTGAVGRSDGLRVHGELGAANSVLVQGNTCFDNQTVQTITDGAMSSVTNPTRLTSAAGGWQTTDIGKPITVAGAGAAGGTLTTTIAGYLSSTVAILADPALTTVSGATVTYGSASTQAFGIVVKDYVNNIDVSGNICHDNTQTGIFYQILVATSAVNARIVYNICYNNGKAGTATLTDGIRVWGSGSGSISGVLISGNRCYDSQGVPTQDYGIAIKDNVTYAQIYGNDVRGNKTGPILNSPTSDATVEYKDNLGVSPLVTKSASYTVTSLEDTVLVDTSGANRTITLPTAVGRLGKEITVKKVAAANSLIIDTTSSQTIDGATTATILDPYTSVTLVSDNANWHIT